jgi:hypothetical protein
MKKKTLSTFEASQFLGVATQTLSNWRHMGRGPKHEKNGVFVQYNMLDLIEYKKARKKANARKEKK